MHFTLKNGKLLWAAALLAVPGMVMAQDNAMNNVANADASVANDSMADPALSDPALSDPAMTTTTAPMDDTMANDMALADSVEPERDDKDFPWGLLGLLGLAGLMGRKKDGDIHVDARTDRRDA
ncbi:MAG TPA: WGxxGxxG-CTERM domain-containing protein [Sphingomicrobium sp.]|nr:WGxxGxxG-CTERM domain-containing protein [Sphingomicrobium sp.]